MISPVAHWITWWNVFHADCFLCVLINLSWIDLNSLTFAFWVSWKNCCHQIQKISNSSCENGIHIQFSNKISFNDDENGLNDNCEFAAVSTVSSIVSSKIVSFVTVFCEKIKKEKSKNCYDIMFILKFIYEQLTMK